ncbi:MAG: dual specificity protein phosphatase family protein [Candidatus Dormibacteraeota bacterium]|uniref:Dual specificity protein phosphatase family protein n=1 Tax=Candidatus Aeolococcus gillhamiae TaxID=3127015 RepID=A0A934K3X4_9BACT|nr:dual specificity protein phosphatase family protein [Candidatus Dormibacteraeota bacterium]
MMVRAGVSCVVDLRAAGRPDSPWPDEVQVLACPLAEYAAPDVATVAEISRQVALLIEGGGVAFLHCRAGVQRAPLVACSVLMQMGWGLPAAFRLVASRRTQSAMSDQQLEVLRTLERRLASERVDGKSAPALP